MYGPSPLTVEEKFIRTGSNTGNLLFISTLHKAVTHAGGQNFDRFDVAEVREKHDGIIVPAANWFNYYSDWGGLADKIEATKLPCVIVGLGAQSHVTSTFPNPKPGTLRLVKVISERSASISVRGAYSAAALNHHGIKNVTVTGCPSLLWHLKPLHVSKPARKVAAVAIGTTRSDLYEKVFDPQPSFRASVLLARWALANDYFYVAQSELFDMKVATGEPTNGAMSEHQGFLQRVYGLDSFQPVQEYLKRRSKVFFNVEAWLDFLQPLDFIVSTRLHGVIASLLAGVPALLIVHDTRTREMAQHIKIPYLEAADLVERLSSGSMDIDRMYEAADLEAFNKNQPMYYKAFLAFFAKNGVDVVLPQERTSVS